MQTNLFIFFASKGQSHKNIAYLGLCTVVSAGFVPSVLVCVIC